jgi:hypothetical protein
LPQQLCPAAPHIEQRPAEQVPPVAPHVWPDATQAPETQQAPPLQVVLSQQASPASPHGAQMLLLGLQ